MRHICLCLLVVSSALSAQEGLPSFAEPGISPDGREIAFVSGGDIWTVPVTGGEARLLIAHPAVESRPLYSPDGRSLAFVSNRSGSNDLWVMELSTGALRRLTFEDSSEQLDGWSPDGHWLYYSSSSRDIAGMHDVYRVSLAGGTPVPVSADRYFSEYWSAPAPDGRRVAITARGTRTAQWWRRGSSHLDQTELWIVHPGAPPSYHRVTAGGAWEAWPMWAPDGETLYYMSDRDGHQNLWAMRLGGESEPLTRFRTGRVLWPSISRDGRMITFERDFGIWIYEIGARQARELTITLRGAAAVAGAERRVTTNEVQEHALAPDGRKVAFTVRGEIFAASARNGGQAARVTHTPALETNLAWAPDSRRLAYASWRNGTLDLFLYDFGTDTETQLTRSPVNDVTPQFSPDGRQLAFVRDGRELRLLDLETRRERVLATGMFDRAPFFSARGFEWSQDGRWIAYLSNGLKGFRNAWVVPVAGGEPRQVTFLSNVFGGSVSWTGDGAALLLDSRQRTEPGQLIRVDLSPRTPVFREDQFRDLFHQETPRPVPGAPPAGRSVAVPADTTRDPPGPFDFEQIRRRLSTIPVNVDLTTQAVSPDGKWVVMVAGAAGQQNLYAWPLDETAAEPPAIRQLTSTAGGKSQLAWSPDSKEVYFLAQGRITAYHLETRATRTVTVTTEMTVDFAAEKMAVFDQAWAYQRDNFYDPDHHGVDWTAVRVAYAPRIAGARTPDEMRRLLALMVGELNASHLGVSAPGGGTTPSPTGRLGLRFDPALLERGQFRVADVLPLSPAAIGGIRAGELLLAVDGVALGPAVNLDSLLNDKVGRRVTVRVGERPAEAGREVVVRPVNTGTEKGLHYRAWVEERRAYVERISDGRLGYVHMPDMSAGALAQLSIDLDEENHGRDGVVIDIRNNNGGFVHAYALDIFARRPYLTMTNRGREPAPARTQLGQRALEKPTVLVTNQHSLSDAEDFTEGYRAMGLGPVIGEPTSGWIIYTSNVPLVDGTVLRLPFIRVQGADGEDMERAPRPVDISVRRMAGESYSGRDRQLEQAVEELLRRLTGG